MLREHLQDSFDTHFREGTNSEDLPTVTNSEIGLYLHILSSTQMLAKKNFRQQKEGHTGAAFLYDVAGEFECLAGEIGKASFQTTWSFPLLAAPVDESGKQRQYGPRSDLRLELRGFPHCIIEVSSHDDRPLANQIDLNRMILQGSCLARLGNALRKKEFKKELVVISAIFIDSELVAHEYFMYQPVLGDNKVLYHEKTFELSDPKGAFEFIFRLYNLISRTIKDSEKLDESLVYGLKGLKAIYPYNKYPALTTEHLNDGGSDGGTGGSRKRRRTEKGNTEGKNDALKDISVYETLEDAGYQITEEEDDTVLGRLSFGIRMAISRDGAPIVLKFLDDDTDDDGTDELKILQYLSKFRSPLNHAIELHGVVNLTIGRVIALPCRIPLDFYLDSRHPPRSAESLQTQLLEGVAFLHEHKIAHLDLKPGNMVVDSEHDRHSPRLSIIDFGLSVFVEDEETMIEGYCGTRTWTAPEVGKWDEPDTKYSPILADRWACGQMVDYLEGQVGIRGVSRGMLRRLCEGLLDDNPRSRPSVSDVLESYGRYERGRMVKRRAEDEMDVLRKRICVNC
ncbi:kinase-like domain-containing protein [Multifurca ochricompacta]|uniref:Kinase-like domain-containing protein n=1 Tax=Multifurca ochricompacta TaxID=376703 RepID=A0AAD4LVA7_9AGAM|nr:kinase-like domain-containing protein [Multifurca ochricompacta]